MLRFLLRFTAAYVLLLVVFGLAGVPGLWAGILALFGATVWPYMAAVGKNGRDFGPREKLRVILAVLAVDLTLHLVVQAMSDLLAPAPQDVRIVIFGLGLIVFLHAACLSLGVFLLGRLAARHLQDKKKPA